MILRRLDDYQGWQVIFGGTSILFDPWLTDEPITGSFDRRKSASAIGMDEVRSEQIRSENGAAQSISLAAIALCTAVSDHARPATLAALAQVPVVGPAKAAHLARRAGSRQADALRPGQCRVFDAPDGGRLELTATRTGLPLGLIAIGYLVSATGPDGEPRGRIWLEPHQPTANVASSIGPIDLALLPMQSVTATVLPVTAGPRASLAAARMAHARAIVPTATDPRRDMTGWQRALYRVSPQLRPDPQAGAKPEILSLQAGESLRVPAS